jgi:hypothetical protein
MVFLRLWEKGGVVRVRVEAVSEDFFGVLGGVSVSGV